MHQIYQLLFLSPCRPPLPSPISFCHNLHWMFSTLVHNQNLVLPFVIFCWIHCFLRATSFFYLVYSHFLLMLIFSGFLTKNDKGLKKNVCIFKLQNLYYKEKLVIL